MATQLNAPATSGYVHRAKPMPVAHATDTFDAAAWFAAWSDHGGVAMLINGQLWVGRIAAIDREAVQRLNRLRAALAMPDAAAALTGLLQAKAWEVEA